METGALTRHLRNGAEVDIHQRVRMADGGCSHRPLARSGDSDNQGEIREGHHSSPDELPPLVVPCPAIAERSQAGNDENDVRDSTDRHHHRFKSPHLARMNDRPKRQRPRLHEMRPKQIEAIPEDRDGNASAKPPNAIAARENYDGNIDECLEQVKKPKLRDNQG
jgi:hypothetical protein